MNYFAAEAAGTSTRQLEEITADVAVQVQAWMLEVHDYDNASA